MSDDGSRITSSGGVYSLERHLRDIVSAWDGDRGEELQRLLDDARTRFARLDGQVAEAAARQSRYTDPSIDHDFAVAHHEKGKAFYRMRCLCGFEFAVSHGQKEIAFYSNIHFAAVEGHSGNNGHGYYVNRDRRPKPEASESCSCGWMGRSWGHHVTLVTGIECRWWSKVKPEDLKSITDPEELAQAEDLR